MMSSAGLLHHSIQRSSDLAGGLVDCCQQLFERRFANRAASNVLIVLFLALGWARAVIEKMIDPAWWRGEVIDLFIADHRDNALILVRPLLDMIGATTVLVAVLVITCQALVAASLLSGRALSAGLCLGAALNLAFILAGATNPSVFYLLLECALLFAVVDAAQPSPALAARLARARIGFAVIAISSMPFVSTLHPSHAKDDPALVITTWSFCSFAAMSCIRRSTRRAVYDREVTDLRDKSIADTHKLVTC